MLKGKMVRVRGQREYVEQPSWVFIGKVLEFSENWLLVEGKGIFIFRRKLSSHSQTAVKGLKIVHRDTATGGLLPALVDEEKRTMAIPRDAIHNVRVLPDDFDIDNMRLEVVGQRVDVVVDGAPNTAVDEIGEY